MTARDASRPKVLLIEDDAVFAAYLSERLGQLGYEVESQSDGLRGLHRLREDDAHVIIVDLALPGLDGMSLLEKLKAEDAWPKTPIVVLTGRFSASDVERATKLGVDDYIAKPFNEAQFFGRLAELTAARRPQKPIVF